MGQQWKNAPLYFTVAQIRFNPILSLPTYLPDIQEHFRKRGYPDFKKTLAMTFNLPLIQNQNEESQHPTTQHVERYTFSNLENTKNFNLEQNALSFQTTQYVHFEQFASDLEKGLEIVHKIVGLSFVERIGIRNLDAVMPREGETLDDYLIPAVMGLCQKLSGKTQYSFSETLTHEENGSVLSRTVIQDGQIGFPPDIMPAMALNVEERFRQFSGMHAVIDADAFYSVRISFDLKEVMRKLDALHKCTSASFQATIKEHARTVWA